MYSKTTKGIKVQVEPQYLADQSEPGQNHYVWAYTVVIENLGGEKVQLLRRYWHITDAHGQMQEVRGDGVIGEQPVLEAGGQYRYTSGASLKTPSGIMVGSYTMVSDEEGEEFDVGIPAFSLDSPYQVIRQH